MSCGRGECRPRRPPPQRRLPPLHRRRRRPSNDVSYDSDGIPTIKIPDGSIFHSLRAIVPYRSFYDCCQWTSFTVVVYAGYVSLFSTTCPVFYNGIYSGYQFVFACLVCVLLSAIDNRTGEMGSVIDDHHSPLPTSPVVCRELLKGRIFSDSREAHTTANTRRNAGNSWVLRAFALNINSFSYYLGMLK